MHEPATLEEAAALLGQYAPEARLLAGGTDLLVDLKTGRGSARHLVSIHGIGQLHGVLESKAGLRIGALTTISQLDGLPIIAKRYAAIQDATREMAAPQIRNAATVGGNIAGAVPCADLPPVLMVMNASIVLWSAAGERTVAIEDLFVGPRETILCADEVLTAVIVPDPPDRFGAAYARFALRDGNAIAVAAVAAALELDSDGTVREARVALGAVSPTPKLVEAAGASLIGRALGDDAINDAAEAAMEAAEPISDVRGSAEYRRELVGILTPRAVATACERAKELRR
ncbi:MAG: xanthine dehydrogenase family protein subunit M [Phycisphaeraceae bacterium]